MKTLIKSTSLLFALCCASSVYAQDIKGGEVIGKNIYGLATDYNGDPLLVDERPLIYSTSSFDEEIVLGKQTFLVSAFNQPIGGVYVTYIDKKTKKFLDTSPLELSGIGGLSHPQAGIRALWGSVILAEAGLVDAANAETFNKDFKAYYKGKDNLVNPYNYGWLSEIIVLDAEGQAKAIKNYAMGRVFADQFLIMPDSRTVYMLDSQASGNLYVFIAEQPYSMVKGSLYAVGRTEDKLSYIPLGETSALKLKFRLKKISFDSMFSSKTPKNNVCAKKYTHVQTVYGEECLKLKAKGKKYAPIFEPIRTLALKGVAGFGGKQSQMQFDTNNKLIRFKQTGKAEIAFPVNEDTHLNSQYIIKEPS